MLSVWALGLGCSAPVLDLLPDADRTGLDGTDGPFGVAHQTFHAQARVTDSVRYEVSWPARAGGGFDDSAGRCPVVMFIHGGFVHADQYRWLASHVASRGYCAVSPEHALQLAILESDNASVALDDLQQRPPAVLDGAIGEAAVVLGHSLGGAVAAFRWIADDRFDGLGLLASWPAETSPVESMRGRPSLSLIGSEDKGGEATQTAHDEYQRFREPAWFGVVDGMNHYDWADGASDADLSGDGVPTRPQSETRRDVLRVLDAWLDAWLRDDAAAREALDARAFPNVAESP
ncbi:MAG: pimeloyl-ACP methyl ester carboxylesterase [Myxococcota bacterium]|jgi:pimeloyl-ACP methyl ester carboxylesterase